MYGVACKGEGMYQGVWWECLFTEIHGVWFSASNLSERFIFGIIKWVSIGLDVAKRVRLTSAVTSRRKCAAICKHTIL